MSNNFKKIDRLIELTEEQVRLLVRNDMKAYNSTMSEFSELLNGVFPAIIVSFSDKRLSDYSGDALYWSNQLGSIVDSMAKSDRFKIADVLYYETRENLINYRELITSRGIDL